MVLREGVTIVHGHQATSCMTNEALLYARTLGLTACYTDHSLFGFADVRLTHSLTHSLKAVSRVARILIRRSFLSCPLKRGNQAKRSQYPSIRALINTPMAASFLGSSFIQVGSIHINKVLQCTLSDVDAAICVSNACRENLVLRTGLPPELAYTIPNAVDPDRFTPKKPPKKAPKNIAEEAVATAKAGAEGGRRRIRRRDDEDINGAAAASSSPLRSSPCKGDSSDRVVVVVVSRLVHRKGTDLLARVIPQVCAAHPQVDFLVGGDGPK